MRWAGHVARVGQMKNVYKLLPVKPEGKRPLGKEWGWYVCVCVCLDSIHLAQGMAQWLDLGNTVMNLRVP